MNASSLAARMRAMLASRSASPADDAGEIARQWAQLLTDAQTRIDRAVAWLERGLRSEALELARTAPSVFDTARIAWDPALAGWDDHCVRNKLFRAPLLLRTSIDRLSEAHLQVEPMANALARWRKLNIGRAAATERLDQLRLLRRLDPDNPVWIDDSPLLERAALAEAIEASERALALWEIDRVWGVIRWIESGEWTAAPADAAATALRDRVRQLSGRSALERANEVVQRLHAEYMAESVDSAEEHLREWEALRSFLAETGMQAPRELDESVQPVVEWLRERQEASQRLLEHRTSVEELAALVEAPMVTLGSLHEMLERVRRGPEAVAPDLVGRAQRRIRSLERARMARRAMAALAAVVAVAILLGAAYMLIDRHARRTAAEAFLEHVDRAISLGDFDGLDAVVERSLREDPRLGETDAPAEARRRIAQAKAQRVRDDAAFDAGLDAAGDPARPGATDDALAPLDALARTAQQRAQLDEWRGLRRAAETARRDARDQAFIAALSAIEASLAHAGSLTDSEASLEMPAIRARLEELTVTPEVSAPVLARARPVLVRLESLEQALAQRRALSLERAGEHAEIDELLPLLHRPHDFAAALRRFAERHPGSVHAQGFLDAAIEEPVWSAVPSWADAIRSVPRSVLLLDDAERAEARRALRDFLSAHPRSVHSGAAERLVAHLEPANEWRKWLGGVLESSPLLGLRMLEMRNGDRFYYEETQAPQPTSDGAKVYRIVKSLKDPAKGVFETEFLRLDPKQIVSDGESPQRVLSRVLRAALRDGSLQGPEGLLSAMERVRDATGVNAVLRAELLAGMLDRLDRAAPSLHPLLQESRRRLGEFEFERVPWLDPRSSESSERAREIDAALPRLMETKRWRSAWQESAAAADASRASALEPVGLLLVEGDRRELRSTQSPPPGELLVVSTSASGAGQIRVVGRAVTTQAGAVRSEFDATAIEAVPSGTPIFQRRGEAPRSAP